MTLGQGFRYWKLLKQLVDILIPLAPPPPLSYFDIFNNFVHLFIFYKQKNELLTLKFFLYYLYFDSS